MSGGTAAAETPIVTPAALFAVLALVVASLSVAALAERPAPPSHDAARGRLLVAVERPDGGLDLRDRDGRPLGTLAFRRDLFAITALRGVAGRIAPPAPQGANIPASVPASTPAAPASFPVFLFEDREGAMRLRDPRTHREIALDGFGVDNRAAFARYLPAASDPSAAALP